jgi:hypothetical protein
MYNVTMKNTLLLAYFSELRWIWKECRIVNNFKSSSEGQS